MSTQVWLGILFLVLVVVWIAELYWIARMAEDWGRDALTLVSGAAIFFVLAAPLAIVAPGLVERVGHFWEVVIRPLGARARQRRQSTPRLVMPGRTVLLEQERIRIGRYPNNDIVIDHPTVSAYHAELVRRGDGRYELHDRESRNGTRINGTPIRQAILKDGDQITLGAITVHYLEGTKALEALNRGGVPLRRR
ncbi:MAG: FHA domain-containing protein [Thermomicrobium sp.]|nr:FHA domain-containing protein [Thermomicrobium sp.]MDW7982913.1 FHA domain-containing protein [Thermomicrobium sp.]